MQNPLYGRPQSRVAPEVKRIERRESARRAGRDAFLPASPVRVVRLYEHRIRMSQKTSLAATDPYMQLSALAVFWPEEAPLRGPGRVFPLVSIPDKAAVCIASNLPSVVIQGIKMRIDTKDWQELSRNRQDEILVYKVLLFVDIPAKVLIEAKFSNWYEPVEGALRHGDVRSGRNS